MKVLLIHTGGTIAMVQTPQGFATAEGVIEAALAEFEDAGLLTCEVDLLHLDPAIDSANATPQDWNRITQAIVAGHDAYAGFVVTHGTDTLAFTAAALTFALHGLTKPVIVTGAMRPMTVAGSDGMGNLADALQSALTAPAGVWVQFAGKLMHGARVRKKDSEGFDAFTAQPTAKPPHQPGPVVLARAYAPPEIAILTMAPGQSSLALTSVLDLCAGVVLRVFGAGTLPDEPALHAALLRARDRGAVMVAISQTTQGGVSLGTYAAGAPLLEAGVVDGGDLTAEAAYVKLALVLSEPGTAADRRARMASNFCGERND